MSTPTTTTEVLEDPWADENHPAWLGLASRFGRWARTVSSRDDLIVRATPDTRDETIRQATPRPPGCFVPALAEIRLSTDAMLTPETDDPDRIDPTSAADRALYPVATGVACHEAAHAAHTRLMIPPGTDPTVARWAEALEEPRIEHQLITHRPQDRVWLRAAAEQIVANGSLHRGDEATGSAAQAAHTAILLLGRAVGGVFTRAEVAQVEQRAIDALGDTTLDGVMSAVNQALTADDGDSETMLAAAARIAELVPGQPPEQQDQDQQDQQGGEPGSGSDQQDDALARQLPCGAWTAGDLAEDTDPWTLPEQQHTDQDTDEGGAESGTPGELTNAAKQATGKISTEAATHAKAAMFRPRPPRNTDAERDNARAEQNRRNAAAVFTTGDTTPEQVQVDQHTPGAGDQEQARALTAALRTAQYRAQTKTRVKTETPPGRMHMSEVMRRQAQREAKARITATPWRRTVRRTVPNPPLTVGVSVDVSYSMEDWQQPASTFAWTITTALTRLAGTTSAVTWNTTVTPLIAPGTTPATVPVATPVGGSSGCPASLRTLDGALRLSTNHTGARVVIVVTDGAVTYPDPVQAEVNNLTRTGVHVLWVTDSDTAWCPTSAHHVPLHDPATFGGVIGTALVAALEQA